MKRKCSFENSTMHSSDQDVEAVAPDSGNPDVPEPARVEDSSDSAQSQTHNDMQTPANLTSEKNQAPRRRKCSFDARKYEADNLQGICFLTRGIA